MKIKFYIILLYAFFINLPAVAHHDEFNIFLIENSENIIKSSAKTVDPILRDIQSFDDEIVSRFLELWKSKSLFYIKDTKQVIIVNENNESFDALEIDGLTRIGNYSKKEIKKILLDGNIYTLQFQKDNISSLVKNMDGIGAHGYTYWVEDSKWKDMLDLLEGVGMPETLGFQADLAHTYLYLMGYNAPDHALLQEGYTEEEFYSAYEEMTDKLRPWTIDFHVAQNDGEVHGAGDHDKTGKHCPADDPNGKLDITRCSQYWLKDFQDRGIKHICWDGCMFSNATLETPSTWNTILKSMIDVVS